MKRRAKSAGLLFVLLSTMAGVAGAAEPVASVNQGETPTESAPVDGPPPMGAVFVDPLGFALFGPTLGAELALGDASVALTGRWLNAGLLAGALFLDGEEKFAFSGGLGVEGRYWLSAPLRGPFLGLKAEYLQTRIENDSTLIATETQLLVPQLTGGYRYGGGRLFAGGQLAVGYAVQVGDGVENLPGGTSAHLYRVEDVSTVYGCVALELGMYF